MASVNKIQLIGNVGQDPILRYLPSGKAVANISIATTSNYKDKNTGEKVETTEWHRVQFFDKLAEIVGEYVKKGSPLYVEGRLKYGKYTDKDGIEKPTCDIIANEMQLLGGRQGSQESSAAPSAPRPQNAPPKPAPRSAGNGGFTDMDKDLDIPFSDPMKNRAFSLAT